MRTLIETEACRARLSRSARIRNAGVLGDFLAKLHALPVADYDLPGDVLDRRNFGSRLPSIVERLDAIRSHGVIDSPEPWLEFVLEV